MTDLADVAKLFPKARRLLSGEFEACCPLHEDRKPSMTLGMRDGALVVHCHAGCDQRALYAEVLRQARAAVIEPTKPDEQDRPKRRIVATYDYADARGDLVFQVVRYEPKEFRQRRPDCKGGWIWGRGDTPPLPYRLSALLNATEVFIVEGEKDADSLAKLGLVATTNPGGADNDGEAGRKWPQGFGRYFEGRHVILIPDNDDAGRRHIQAVAHKLAKHAASIRILELPDLPPKGDVSDWLANGGTRNRLEELAAGTPYWEPAETVQANGGLPYALLRDIKPNLDRNDIVRDLIPRRAFGEVHAESAGGKTAILVDLMLHIAAGVPYRGRRVERQAAVYLAFEGHGGIDNRVYASSQEIGVFDAPFALLKTTSSFKDPEVAKKVAQFAAELMQLFGGDCPVIVIDTYQAALGAGASDCDPKDVTAFIASVQQHLLTTCTVIIAHHFGKDASRGGRGWSGLRAALDFELEIDQDGDLRTMRLTKSRDGSDRQPALCYRFRGREVGINKYGEPVTAVVVEHLADEDVAKRGKQLSPKARAALGKLWELIKDRSKSFPITDQPGLRCVLLRDFETACVAHRVLSQSPERKQRRRVFRDALTELQVAGAVILDGAARERVYPAPTAHRKEPANRPASADGEQVSNGEQLTDAHHGEGVSEVSTPYKGAHRSPTAHRDGDDCGQKSTSDDLEEKLARLRRRDVPPPSVAGHDAGADT